MKKSKCPHCGQPIVIAMRVSAVTAENYVAKNFPRSWKKYGGERFADVYLKDSEYITECLDNDDIIGDLRVGLEAFYNNLNGGNI